MRDYRLSLLVISQGQLLFGLTLSYLFISLGIT